VSARARWRPGWALGLLAGLLAPGTAPGAEDPLVPVRGDRQPAVLHQRLHEAGATLLRFREGRMHFALALDTRPAKVEERRVTLADGRRLDFRWSGRSLWIAGSKFELPFGDVILVETRGAPRARALEFRAVRGTLMLEQALAAPAIAAWIEARGGADAPPVRQEAQAASEPRHTTEIASWRLGDLHAFTFALSGDPLLVLIGDRPVSVTESRTSLGAFAGAELRLGGAGGDRVGVDGREARFALRGEGGTIHEHVLPLEAGRVFLLEGDQVRQADARFDLGPDAAEAWLERIEALHEVARHLGLERSE
jgi:hypothetical protein